jgi:hypothetical protein
MVRVRQVGIWEIIIISIIGVSAAGYLVWIFFGRRKNSPPCTACPHSTSCKKPDKIILQDLESK